MEHKYLQTTIGKIHAAIVVPSMFICLIGYFYEYSKGKTPVLWGLIISFLGVLLFLKAKYSVIKKGIRISWGCDLMDQKNTNLYFIGWVLMIGGYFMSFW